MDRVSKVIAYQKVCDDFKLYFTDIDQNDVNSVKVLIDLDSIVHRVLELTETYDSRTDTEPWTEASSSRSSIDIYRLILGLGLDIKPSLPEVMASIYRNRGKMGATVCGMAGRRVFYREEDPLHWGDDDTDEYGLTFHEWEDIDKSKGKREALVQRLGGNGEEDEPYGYREEPDFDSIW